MELRVNNKMTKATLIKLYNDKCKEFDDLIGDITANCEKEITEAHVRNLELRQTEIDLNETIDKMTRKFDSAAYDHRAKVKSLEKQLDDSQHYANNRFNDLKEIKIIITAINRVWFPDKNIDPNGFVELSSDNSFTSNGVASESVFNLLRHIFVTAQ